MSKIYWLLWLFIKSTYWSEGEVYIWLTDWLHCHGVVLVRQLIMLSSWSFTTVDHCSANAPTFRCCWLKLSYAIKIQLKEWKMPIMGGNDGVPFAVSRGYLTCVDMHSIVRFHQLEKIISKGLDQWELSILSSTASPVASQWDVSVSLTLTSIILPSKMSVYGIIKIASLYIMGCGCGIYNISNIFRSYKCHVKIIEYINVFHFYLLRFQDLNVIIAKSFKKPMENWHLDAGSTSLIFENRFAVQIAHIRVYYY